jgi:hypothetical protein
VLRKCFWVLLLAGCLVPGGCSGEVPDSPNLERKEFSTIGENGTQNQGKHFSFQDFTFRVNDNMPLYDCTVTVSEPVNGYGFGRILQAVITETDSGLPVQAIILPDEEYYFNENALKSAAYFIDVTFDGKVRLGLN